jgi:hypothetical protein
MLLRVVLESTLLYAYRLLCLGCSGIAVPLNVSLMFWFSYEINESRIRVLNMRNCLVRFNAISTILYLYDWKIHVVEFTL